MLALSRSNRHMRIMLALIVPLVLSFFPLKLTFAATSLVQVSSDPYTNSTSQHQTEVEPDTFAAGSTIVSTFQVGRFSDGGSSNIGWATSSNNGSSWTKGFLPGTTVFATPAGNYDRVSDPTVAYDAMHKTWLIASLALTANSSVAGAAIIVNLSTDGGLTWSNPVLIHAAGGSENLDKDWITCDSTASSPYYGHCYVEWDNPGGNNTIYLSTSTDGGRIWSDPQTTQDFATGVGGQPLVQPDGTVVVPIDNADANSILAFTSTDGGQTWGSTVTVADIQTHTIAGNLRSLPLISAMEDSSGEIYVVWQDCRFEQNCSTNDIVMSTSTNGTSWSSVTRIPIDAVGSGVDHFIPGIGIDKTTAGNSAHLIVTYYYYPQANCSSSTCQLEVGYTASTDGGADWTSGSKLAGPMSLSWLAETTQGVMVGDYIATAFTANGSAFSVFAVGNAPDGGSTCSTSTTCHLSMFTTSSGLSLKGKTHHVVHDAVLSKGIHNFATIPLTAR